MAKRDWGAGARQVDSEQAQMLAYVFSLAREGRFDEARNEIEARLHDEPQSAQLLRAYGLVLQRERRYDEALPYFEEAAQHEPENARTMLLAGRSGLGAGNAQEAEHSFAQALKANPRSAAAHLGLAKAREEAGDKAGAVDALEQALAVDPQMVPARLMLARTFTRDGETDKAIHELEHVVHIKPGHPAASTALAAQYLSSGDSKRAIAMIDEAVRANPDNHRLLSAAGRMKMQAKDYAGAETVLRRAVSLQGGSAILKLTLADALIHQKKLEDARTLIGEVRRVGPLRTLVQRAYAELFAAEGMYEDAEQNYRAVFVNMRNKGEAALARIDGEREKAQAAGPEAVIDLYRAEFRAALGDSSERRSNPEFRERMQAIRSAMSARRGGGANPPRGRLAA